MAEITPSETGKKTAGVARSKKLSTRIDLTPMVDLGFLLITFFVFTTTIDQPTSMKIVLPDDKGKPTPVKETGALTLLLGANSKVFYYEGKIENAGSNLHNTVVRDVRQVIMDKKKSTVQKDLLVIIKPTDGAVLKDVVDILDEMTISDIHRYMLVDITNDEEALVMK